MQIEQMWLSYKKDAENPQKKYFENIYRSNTGTVLNNAVAELCQAAEEMFEIIPNITCTAGPEKGICLQMIQNSGLGKEGFTITEQDGIVFVTAEGETGILYGVFEVIRLVRTGYSLEKMEKRCIPDNPLRMLNHWDNMDGSIERGYSGESFFFKKDTVIINQRIREYARLLASVGINGTVINNVNVFGKARYLITEEYLDELETLSEIFRNYGIRLFVCINYASPIFLGMMETADPLNPDVIQWWTGTIAKIYRKIPDFGGFLVKADSEGQPGPFDYGRTHAEGANMLAEILKPYGGIVIWRCFVYGKQDWREYDKDRAKAAYEAFMPIDGQFSDNVILQIKNGPVDFQVREPVSPLFGGLKKTNQMLELQVAQEYTGQQIDVCYLVPMWSEILNFKTYIDSPMDTVADIVSGKTYGNTYCGIAGVSNTGNDDNWTGNDLAAANLYGYGRLAFQTGLSPEEITKEWICQTFGKNREILDTLSAILLKSWNTFEKYTCPMGTGWMMDETTHYEPVIEEQEYGPRGTYHRADHVSIGRNRGKSGTDYVSQYHEPLASMYDNIETCPEEMLLFFHHVRYDYRLKNGKTLLQHIYDTHFEGVEEVEEMKKRWESLKPYVDEKIYRRVLERFERQLYMAAYWRDSVNTYFYRKSMIDDEKGRKIYR